MSDEYPLSHVFGEFPSGTIEKLCEAVAKRKVELVALRNTKNVRSSSIEGLLIGPGQPMEMIGYEPKKTFSLGESGRAILDGYHPDYNIAVEIEKGRILLGNQLYVDLYKFIAIDEIDYAAIIVPKFPAKALKSRLKMRCEVKVLEPKLEALGIKGLAIIGY